MPVMHLQSMGLSPVRGRVMRAEAIPVALRQGKEMQMQGNWKMRTGVAWALGLSLALGTSPLIAHATEAGIEGEEAAVEAQSPSEVTAQAETIQLGEETCPTIRVGETVSGVLTGDFVRYAIVGEGLDPNVDVMADIKVRVTEWGTPADGDDSSSFDATLELLPAAQASSALGFTRMASDASSEGVIPATHLRVEEIENASKYMDGQAAYTILIGGTEGSAYELGVKDAGISPYYIDYPVDYQSHVRLWGEDAFGTMQACLREAPYNWGKSAGYHPDMILATSDGYWDALAAAGLAGLNYCPVVVTPKDSLDAHTRAEIIAMDIERVTIVGGPNSVQESVADEVRSLGVEVDRVYGQDAAGTANAIYEAGKGFSRLYYPLAWSDTAIIATSSGYWDALSIASYSGAKHAPIFLTNSDKVLAPETLDILSSGGFSRAIIVGGPLSVSGAVHDQLNGIGLPYERLEGETAIDTSAKTVAWCHGEGLTGGLRGRFFVATTQGYWDALCGSPWAACEDAPLVLVDSEGEHLEAVDALLSLSENEDPTCVVLGGEMSVSAEAMQKILDKLA